MANIFTNENLIERVTPDMMSGVTNDYNSKILDGATGKYPEYQNPVSSGEIFGDAGINPFTLDVSPRRMCKVTVKSEKLKPAPAIKLVIKSFDVNGHGTYTEIMGKEAETVLQTLQNKIYQLQHRDVDLRATYDKFKVFRHFIHMLKAGLLGCRGHMDRGTNKVIIAVGDESPRELQNIGGRLLFKGLPAVTEFSPEAIDGVGQMIYASYNKVTAGQMSLYEKLLRESGYVGERKAKQYMDKVKSADDIVKNSYTFGKNNVELADEILKSDNPEDLIQTIASEVSPKRYKQILQIATKA